MVFEKGLPKWLYLNDHIYWFLLQYQKLDQLFSYLHKILYSWGGLEN